MLIAVLVMAFHSDKENFSSHKYITSERDNYTETNLKGERTPTQKDMSLVSSIL